jgi:glycosyltransferase involved in cell wall biosynthesis
MNQILKEVGISTIVRDEIENPAGGIERFVHSHAPFVSQMVVQDTGSTDGTYETLKKLAKIYSNLFVPEPILFEGYSDARNKCLSYIKTPLTLVLDADELITSENPKNNWAELKLAIFSVVNQHKDLDSFSLKAMHIFLENEFDLIPYNPQRLFRTGKVEYYRDVFENPWVDSSIRISVPLFHFLPSLESRSKKMKNWYRTENTDFKKNISEKISPRDTEGFQEWKEYNPKRDNYE